MHKKHFSFLSFIGRVGCQCGQFGKYFKIISESETGIQDGISTSASWYTTFHCKCCVDAVYKFFLGLQCQYTIVMKGTNNCLKH